MGSHADRAVPLGPGLPLPPVQELLDAADRREPPVLPVLFPAPAQGHTEYFHHQDGMPLPVEVPFRDARGRIVTSPASHPTYRPSPTIATAGPSRSRSRRRSNRRVRPSSEMPRPRLSRYPATAARLRMPPFADFIRHIMTTCYRDPIRRNPPVESSHQTASRGTGSGSRGQRGSQPRLSSHAASQLTQDRSPEQPNRDGPRRRRSSLTGGVAKCVTCGSSINGRGRPRLNQQPCFDCGMGSTVVKVESTLEVPEEHRYWPNPPASA